MPHLTKRIIWSVVGFATVVIVLAGVFFAVERGRVSSPTLAHYFLDRGNHYFNTKGEGVYDLDKAEQYFERAVDFDADVPDAWHQLARISFLRGDFEEAMTRINTQIELHGDELMSSYYIRGLIEGFQKDYEPAEADFKKFLEWDTRNWAAHNDLAWLYFEQGKFEEMEAIAREGLEYNSGNAWLLTMYGTALLNLGRKTEAKEVLEEAQRAAELLTPFAWEKAYPGNDPRVSSQGLEQMRRAIEHNLTLVNN